MSFVMALLWSQCQRESRVMSWHFQGERNGICYSGCYHHTRTHTHTHLLLPPHLDPLLPGSRQIQLAVPGAYEKPQLLPLQPPVEAGPPATLTFHVNPVLQSRLEVALEEELTVLQVSELTTWKMQVIESGRREQWSRASGQARFLHSEGLHGVVFSAEQPNC